MQDFEARGTLQSFHRRVITLATCSERQPLRLALFTAWKYVVKDPGDARSPMTKQT